MILVPGEDIAYSIQAPFMQSAADCTINCNPLLFELSPLLFKILLFLYLSILPLELMNFCNVIARCYAK